MPRECRLAVAAAAVLAVAGCAAPDFTTVSDTPAAAFESSLATFDDGFVAAWHDTRDGHAEIYLRRLDTGGHPVGPPRRLTTTTGDAFEIDVQPLAGNVVGAWYEKASDGHLTPRMASWTRDGVARWSVTLATQGRNPVVRAAGDRIFAAWLQDDGDDVSSVWGGWWRADGQPAGVTRRLADASRTTWNLNAALERSAGEPHALVVFDATAHTQAPELFLVDVSDTRTEQRQLTSDDHFASSYPDIAIDRDRVALTWFDERDGNQEVYVAVGGRDLLAAGAPVRPIRVTDSPGRSFGAYLAWNGAQLAVAWCDDSDGNQAELFMRRYDVLGRPVSAAQRLTHTRTDSLVPAIEPWGAGFALLWNEYERAGADGHGGGPSQVAFRIVP